MTFLDRMKTMSIELVEPGRAGAKGTAYTFFTAANARFAKELINILKGAGQKVSPELAAMGRGAPPPPGEGALVVVLRTDISFTVDGKGTAKYSNSV
ncbi:hypothetical protein SAY86_017934 [Trapa natans]|uniref:Uncharacterized protein n=1 Tax=Trapa natans TaxID=22666 RepID=A0AAN7M732_TRANT|nr:hypothetical protein SAY86_017934 [Trapa natans]